MGQIFEINIKTNRRFELVDITSDINNVIKEAATTDGIAFIFIPHTTAGIIINEHADPSVKTDILSQLSKLVPDNGHYQHLEGNADAHIKSALVGNSISVIIEDGRLVLGTWQGIFFAEFDGPRRRKALIKIIKG